MTNGPQLYDIQRTFFPATKGHAFIVIRTGLTLEQAKAHIESPEAASWSATSLKAKLFTKLHKTEWADYLVRQR